MAHCEEGLQRLPLVAGDATPELVSTRIASKSHYIVNLTPTSLCTSISKGISSRRESCLSLDVVSLGRMSCRYFSYFCRLRSRLMLSNMASTTLRARAVLLTSSCESTEEAEGTDGRRSISVDTRFLAGAE